MFKEKEVKCRDSRPCFAKGSRHQCKLLTSTYKDGKCPFCKAIRAETNGKFYK